MSGSSNHYYGISHAEMFALGAVHGECFRLYCAISSFAYGNKTICHPSWRMLAQRMGTQHTITCTNITQWLTEEQAPPDLNQEEIRLRHDKINNFKKNLRRKAQKLEKAGMISLGSYGRAGDPRFTLTLKQRVIDERKERALNAPQGGTLDPSQGASNATRGGTESTQRGHSRPPVNNKNNKKHNSKKNISNKQNEPDRENKVETTDFGDPRRAKLFGLIGACHRNEVTINESMNRLSLDVLEWSLELPQVRTIPRDWEVAIRKEIEKRSGGAWSQDRAR